MKREIRVFNANSCSQNRLTALKSWLPVVLSITFLLSILAFVNLIAPQRLPDDPLERIQRYIRADMRMEAEAVYRQLVESHPENLDYHYRYIRNHYLIRPKPGETIDHAPLLAYYIGLSRLKETEDIGLYALGLIAHLNQDYGQARDYYQSVSDREQKYLNLSLGMLYRQTGQPDLAEAAFQREIALNGDLEEAVPALAHLYLERKETEKLHLLAQEARLRAYLDGGILRRLAYLRGDWLSYLQATFVLIYRLPTPLGASVALIICLVWLIYFTRLSVFGQKPFFLYLFLLLLGASFANASLLLSDLFAGFFEIRISIEWLRSLLMSVVNIGVVEELVKFTPVLLIVLLTRRVDEPVNLLIYGGLSALGFATLENIFYLSTGGLGMALSRFLVSTVFHIAMTLIACYFWARARFIQPGSQARAVILGLGLAALLHGLFDFFLMVPLEKLLAGSYIVAFFMAREVHRMLSNALNTSPRCPEAPPAKMQLRSFGLFLLSTLAITLIVYLDYHTGFSTEIANRQVPLLGLSALPGLIVVSGSLGKITLARGRIIPINNFAYHRAFRKRAGKTGMIPGGCGAQ